MTMTPSQAMALNAPAARINQQHPATAAPPDQSPGALALQQLFGLAQQPGTMSGGSPGYTVSQAGARASTQQAYNTAEANRQQVYSQAINDVLANAPAISQSYDNAATKLAGDATARNASMARAADTRSSNTALAAQRMGLSFMPTTQGLANANQDAQAAKINQNAQAWQGLLASQKGTALSGNDRTANAFRYSGTQAQSALHNLLLSSLSKMQDKYVAGKAGKMSGGTSPALAASIYKTILGNQNTQDTLSLNQAKAADSARSRARGTTTTTIKSLPGLKGGAPTPLSYTQSIKR